MIPLGPPPAAARRLLRWLLPPAWSDDIVANLDDLYAMRARARGPRAARRWYWGQAITFPLRLRLAGDPPAAPITSTRTTMLRSLIHDLRFAVRSHRAHPGVAVAAIASLALGIGLNTAIFSVVDSVLLRPAPLEDFDRLVVVWETDRNSGTMREPGSLPDFFDYRAATRTLDGMGAFTAAEVSFAPEAGTPMRVAGLAVSPDLFDVLRVPLLAGRAFTQDDTVRGAAPVAHISERLWATAFNRDAAIVGRRVLLNEQPVTVAGVVPDHAGFGVLQVLGAAAYSRSFADRGARIAVDVWTPLTSDTNALPRSTHPLFLIGRLASGADVPAAQGEFASLAADLEARYPGDNAGRGAHIESLATVMFGPSRPALLALMGAVGLVLLVACANVANLLLARGAGRAREVAVRIALGAGRGRIARQFLTESLALALAAGAAGVGVAFAGLQWLVTTGPAGVPRLAGATIDARVLLVTLAVSVAVGLIFGMLPAWQAQAARPQAALGGESGRSSTGGRGRRRLRAALVVGELTLAVMLVIGATLLLRSFWRLSAVDTGFQTAGVAKAEYQLPSARYPASFAQFPNFVEVHDFNRRLVERTAARPGLTAVAIAGEHPLAPGFTNSFTVVGREAEYRQFPEISVRRVTPGYFDVVRLPVRQGRGFDERDATLAPTVALINETAAARLFPGLDPIGQSIRIWGSARRIVGVVGDERFRGLAAPPPLAIYLPMAQAPSLNGTGVLLARSDGRDAASLSADLRQAISDVDPALAAFGVEALDATVAASVADRRFTLRLIVLFAVLALGLAAIGVHGLLSYDLAQRSREIGIRLALGADPAALRLRLVGDGLRLAAIGVALGATGAFALARLMDTLLFGISAGDPTTYLLAPAILLGVAALSSYLPARRAVGANPLTVG